MISHASLAATADTGNAPLRVTVMQLRAVTEAVALAALLELQGEW